MAMVGFDFDRWANIHSDLLNEIAKKLYSYHDYIRLRCVCKEWNSILPKIPNHRRDPWLVLPLDFGDESIDTRRVLEEKKIYHVSLPEMKDNFIRGSCHGGWLICVMASDGKLRMLNPFTKAHFDLPPISALPHVVSYEPPNIDGGGGQYNILLDGEIWPMNVVRLHQRVVWKVVISSPPDEENGEFMAVAIYAGFERLAFCRLNDKRWRDIPTGKPSESCFQDVIFFKEKIFAVDVDAQLYVFDINIREEQPLPMLKIGGAPPPPPDIHLEHYYTVNKYLIGCDDDGCLLMLVRHLRTIVHDQDDGDDYDEDEEDDEDDIEEDEEIVEEDELQESTYHMISY